MKLILETESHLTFIFPQLIISFFPQGCLCWWMREGGRAERLSLPVASLLTPISHTLPCRQNRLDPGIGHHTLRGRQVPTQPQEVGEALHSGSLPFACNSVLQFCPM